MSIKKLQMIPGLLVFLLFLMGTTQVFAQTPLTAIGAISGTANVGSVLTAGALTPAGATATYQWKSCATSGGTYTNISGATATTYTLVASDATKYIKVSATGTGSYTGTVTSAAKGPVKTPITAIVAISGTAQVGSVLTAGALTPSGATATYQWKNCATSNGTYVNISGATAATYTLVAGDVSKYIKVAATGSGNYTGTVTSAAKGPVTAKPLTAIAAISGTAQVGYVLTAGALTPSGATATYQWKSCATLNGTYTNISGATATTYTLVAGDGNKYIKVSATGSGGYSGTVTSAATLRIINPIVIPSTGSTKIEAEDYHRYYDTTAGNDGLEYRPDDDVDIYQCNDTGLGYHISLIETGEWLSYTVNISQAAHYKFTFRATGDVDERSLYVLLDDAALTGMIKYSTTGPMWMNAVKDGVYLPAGIHTLKVVSNTTYWPNCQNYFIIERSQDGPVVNAGADYSITLPKKTVSLDGTVTDDGLPNPPGSFTVRWSVASSPAGSYVQFADNHAVDTTATFDYPGTYVLRLTADDTIAVVYDETTITVSEAATRVSLPGRLQTEAYSDQGEGISYHDTTSGNAGSQYRTDNVDIYTCSDTGGGYRVANIATGEWLAYDVNVAETRCYDIVARVAGTTASRQLHVEVDGTNVTGAMTFNSTGGTQVYTNVTAQGVHLTKGKHFVKVVFDNGSYSLNYVDVLNETYEIYAVQGGVAKADIVISSTPARSVTLAANELQQKIQQITGATLPIVTAPTGAQVHIYVGQSSYTDSLGVTAAGLQYDAFKIVAGTNWLVMIGRDTNYQEPNPSDQAGWDAATGTYFGFPCYAIGQPYTYNYSSTLNLWQGDGSGSLQAVYSFLYDLGCRWYFPGTLGEVVPTLTDIGIPATNRTVVPDYQFRQMYMYYNQFFIGGDDEVKWQLRIGLNGGEEAMGPMRGHGINLVHQRTEMKQAHPDWFALWGGVRQTDYMTDGAPCLSSSGLRAANVQFVQDLFDVYNAPMANITPNDGYAYLCECALCYGKSNPERGTDGLLSNYVFDYVNYVASQVYLTHPSKMVTALAYTTYFQPPTNISQMSPNLIIIFCRPRSGFASLEEQERCDKAIEGWKAILPSDKFFIWDYYLEAQQPGYGVYTGIPAYFTSLIRKDLRSLKGVSGGDFIEVMRNYPAWGLPYDALASNHLNCYVTARMYWDSNQDLSAMLDEYYVKFYGPASTQMKAFVEYSELNWREAPYNKQTIRAQMRTLLNAAITAAGSTQPYADRVGLVDDFLAEAELIDP